MGCPASNLDPTLSRKVARIGDYLVLQSLLPGCAAWTPACCIKHPGLCLRELRRFLELCWSVSSGTRALAWLAVSAPQCRRVEVLGVTLDMVIEIDGRRGLELVHMFRSVLQT